MAGERAFNRGEEYFVRGRVRSLAANAGTVNAVVDGSRNYQVSLQLVDGRINYECSCPVGRSGNFCKHCVAVCLAAMHNNTIPERAGESVPLPDLRDCIEGLPHEELVAVALDEAMHNVRLRERFRLRAVRTRGESFRLDEYRRALGIAMEVINSAESASAGQSALDEVKSALSLLLEEGWAEAVLTLTEEALVSIANECRLHEPMRGLSQLLCEFHHEGCRRQMIPTAELAARLLGWQLRCLPRATGDPLGDVEYRYASLLGEEGTLASQRLLANEWREVRESAGRGTPEHSAKFARVAELMTRSAERRNDLETLISIKSHQLNTAEAYLEISRLCKLQGRRDLSLEWALMGKQLFSASEAANLYDFLIAEYEERTEWEKALEIIFARFSAQPSLDCYQRMKGLARRFGAWEVWRDRAIEATRKALDQPLSTFPRPAGEKTKPDQSILVSILLWDDDEEGAWQAARQGECDEDLWLSLAERRANRQPEDALSVYRRLVLRNIERKNNYAYRRAMELVQRIGRIMRKQKRRDEFFDYVDQLRQTHHAQRNFAELVDRMMARYHTPHR